MGTKSRGRSDDLGNKSKDPSGQAHWPVWACVAVSVALLLHFGAVMAVRSECHRRRFWSSRSLGIFRPYHELADLGYSYRYYAEPPPTPVVTATLEFSDGRPEEMVRLPATDGAGAADAASATVGAGECTLHGGAAEAKEQHR